MKEKIMLSLTVCLLISIGCGKKPSELSLRLTEESAYNLGNEQGYKDGFSGLAYKSGYNDKWTFYSTESENEILQEYHSKGYKIGYDRGYTRGKKEYDSKHKAVQTNGSSGSQYSEVVTAQSTPNTYSPPSTSSGTTDFHDWEEDEIRAFYVEIEDCESDEQAEYISNQYYLGDYIEEYGRYFARTSVKSGTYEAELGEKVTSKLYKIRGTDVFMLFKWLPNASKWDEGVLEVWSNKGSFYKKPN